MEQQIKEFMSYAKPLKGALKHLLEQKLKDAGYTEVYSEPKFTYAVGDYPVLLVAHIDTVHKQPPLHAYYDQDTYTVTADEGIGGDDRVGCWMVCDIIKKHKCSVLFCDEEETGCIGSGAFVKWFEKENKTTDVKLIIQIDRRGDKDAVYYDLDNLGLEEYIESFGYFKTATGTFTDICVIAPALKVAAVNFSSGYYHEHTLTEEVHIPECCKIRYEILRIIEDIPNHDKWEWKAVKYAWRGKTYVEGDSWWDDDQWYRGGSALGTTNYIPSSNDWSFDIAYWAENEEGEFAIVTENIKCYMLDTAISKFVRTHTNVCLDMVEYIYDNHAKKIVWDYPQKGES